MMELFHYASHRIEAVKDAAPQEARPDHKPRGLWLSVGDAWAQWCAAESFSGNWPFVYRVTLAPAANVLLVRGHGELDDFTRRFGRRSEYGSEYIRWDEVARDYDGILITPYVWSQRMELMWYYSWDVASGCIWRSRAVKSVEPVSLGEIPAYDEDAEMERMAA